MDKARTGGEHRPESPESVTDQLACEQAGTTADPVLVVTGEVDMATSPLLRSALFDLLASAPTRVTLDLGGVSFIDSSGLGVLVGALKQLRAADVDATLHITNVTGPVRRVMSVTGLDEFFDIESA